MTYAQFCRQEYKRHPQGYKILPFQLWEEKYRDELEAAFEYSKM